MHCSKLFNTLALFVLLHQNYAAAKLEPDETAVSHGAGTTYTYWSDKSCTKPPVKLKGTPKEEEDWEKNPSKKKEEEDKIAKLLKEKVEFFLKSLEGAIKLAGSGSDGMEKAASKVTPQATYFQKWMKSDEKKDEDAVLSMSVHNHQSVGC